MPTPRDPLVGQTVRAVRPMTAAEQLAFGWPPAADRYLIPICIHFSDGTIVTPSQDPRRSQSYRPGCLLVDRRDGGYTPGCFVGITRDGTEFGISGSEKKTGRGKKPAKQKSGRPAGRCKPRRPSCRKKSR